MTNILLIILVVAVGALTFQSLRKKDDASKGVDESSQKLGELRKELENEKAEKNKLSGNNKAQFAENAELKAELKSANQEIKRLTQEIEKFRAEESRKSKDFESKINKLEEMKNAFDDEKKRIRREDEEKLQKEKEERDRLWNEHEKVVISRLADLCKQPQYNFPTYDNKNLPKDFGGKFKPDFMIEFLDQYVIFDAKVSRSDNLQQYIAKNVKDTITKIAAQGKIYPTVFFVVPTEAIATLTTTSFYEQSYQFFVISPDALPVVLASFKKIASYELAEQMDPRDRENIVSLIAEFDHHINLRNALDILAAQHGATIAAKTHTLKGDIKDEVAHKKSKMRVQPFNAAEIKTLMIDSDSQQRAIRDMTVPKASISSEDMRSAESMLS